MEEYLKNVRDSKKYFSVSKYFLFLENEHGIKSPKISERKSLYQKIESECTRICDECNIKVEKILHLALGSINEFPEYILAQVVFSEEFRQYLTPSDPV